MEKQVMKINGVNIVTVEHDGEVFVAVKPICEALGVDSKVQRTKIQEDDILGSVGVLSTSTGADGKSYEMFCLPLKYVYGWLLTINPKNVAPEARERVCKYRKECYDALYDHFERMTRRQNETNQAEIALLKQINEAISEEKAAKTKRKEAESALEKVRQERLYPQMTIFDI